MLDATAVASEPVISFQYPRWSPDGGSLVVNAVRWDAPEANITGMAIGIVDVNGSTQAMPRLLTGWDMWAAYPDWSPTEDLILLQTYDLAFATNDEPSNLYTIHPDGTALKRLTDFGRADSRATQPTWTPDGKRIIFTHVGQDSAWDNPREIAFIDADGTDLQVLRGVDADPPEAPPDAIG